MATAEHRFETTLDDKYVAAEGWLYMTGIQALVRLPIQQRLRDEAQGWTTGGYISGYRGSPMGRYDMELWAAEKELAARNVVFRPGLNEDLAATAIWGSQYVGAFPGAKVDGVFGIWYGKGPGVDRSGDALRHGNLAGTSAKGGVLCLAGDDHGAKSSTIANFSDGIFMAVGMPLLYPSNTQELLDYGLHGIAMSRHSGCWVGMKVVTDVVEGGGSIYVGPDAPAIRYPEPVQHADAFGSGNHVRPIDLPNPQERRLYEFKQRAVLAYARLNELNRIEHDAPAARVGIVSAGKAWQDVQQGLKTLGIAESRFDELGLRLLKLGLIWPLDPELVRRFAAGLDLIVVVEEKRPVIEEQLRAALYGTASQPRLIGKHDGGTLFDAQPGPTGVPNYGETSPALVAGVLARALQQVWPDAAFAQPAEVQRLPADLRAARLPSFCSGCPHGRSTQLPAGSRALAGIGCHTMAMLANPRQTTTVSQMGAEGVMWLGQQPFTEEKHVFANVGDGTYSHSGILAIRQAVAAKVPMTYKLLYNGFVSMTGGQAVETEQSPVQILSGLAAEGVQKMAVVTDEPERYDGVALPAGVEVFHRTKLESVQKQFREFPGVSVILYDQACATEKRRLRKRGKLPEPESRAYINPAVCEGCGDCSQVSSCLSIEPLETELGRKRKINQASCNKDYSCVEGFCPSFVTVRGAKPRRQGAAQRADMAWVERLTMPVVPQIQDTCAILIAGIGGTGVVTVGQTLAVAAHVQGLYCSNLDVTGLAQKYGAVHSHVHMAARPQDLHATRIALSAADLVIGCDLVVSASEETVVRLGKGRTRAVVSADVIPTVDFARNPDAAIDDKRLVSSLRDILGDRLAVIDAQRLATVLLGDPVAANMLMLGAAWQLGALPLELSAIERAIELNGVAISLNKNAFQWGRRAIADPAAVAEAMARSAPSQVITVHRRAEQTLDALIEHRQSHLLAHSGVKLAQRYLAVVNRVRAAEAGLGGGEALTRAVAHNYHRLLAVKDEWEVARLYADPAFLAGLRTEFDGQPKLKFHLGAWPFARFDKDRGQWTKAELGAWVLPVFKVMAAFKGLRGTWLDPFRNNEERRLDARLTEQYEFDLNLLLQNLRKDSQPAAAKLAGWPAQVRGYGHVRVRNAQAAGEARKRLINDLKATLNPGIDNSTLLWV